MGSEDLIREFEKVYKKPELILEDEEYEKKESVQIEVEEIVIGP